MRAPFPPMLATLSRGVVSGPEWVFEEKYDGIRLLAFRDGVRVRLFSRNLIDRTDSWPDVARAIGALPGGELVVDGEVFAFDKMRVSRFQLLQQRAHPTFAAFDLPVLGGRSLMRRPLAERRDALESILAGRSEEHTSELQSLAYLVCRLLLEKKNKHQKNYPLSSR